MMQMAVQHRLKSFLGFGLTFLPVALCMLKPNWLGPDHCNIINEMTFLLNCCCKMKNGSEQILLSLSGGGVIEFTKMKTCGIIGYLKVSQRQVIKQSHLMLHKLQQMMLQISRQHKSNTCSQDSSVFTFQCSSNLIY